jgi:hypothetical protein
MEWSDILIDGYNRVPEYLGGILQDAVIHAGQAAYVRGLLQGRGWQSY